MDREEKRKIRNAISIISIVLVALVGIFLFVSIKNPDMNPIYFYLVVGGFQAVYWVLLDFIEPKLLHQLEGISPEQKDAYVKYVLLDLAGYVGVAVFLFSIGGSSNGVGLAGAIVYIFTMTTKKKFRERFLGISNPADLHDRAEEVEQEAEELSKRDELESDQEEIESETSHQE